MELDFERIEAVINETFTPAQEGYRITQDDVKDIVLGTIAALLRALLKRQSEAVNRYAYQPTAIPGGYGRLRLEGALLDLLLESQQQLMRVGSSEPEETNAWYSEDETD